MKLNFRSNLFVPFFTFAAFSLLASNALAEGLMITPSRVEFNEKNKTQEVRLINNGKETTTYRISFQNLRMKEDGSYIEINDKEGAKEKFAEEYVKFSPKRVTLKPGESQAVRLKARIPDEVGEYRSHMLFKEELPADFGNNVEDVRKDKNKEIAVVLRPVFAISIPVIIASGDLEANVSLENPKITSGKDGKKNLNLFIKRSGNGSTNGSIVASIFDKTAKSKTEILSVSNISAFFPYEGRFINFPINLPKEIKLSGKTIEVKYIARKPEDKKDQPDKILSQTTFSEK